MFRIEGAVEAVFTVLAVKHQHCPPTVNLTRHTVDQSLLEHTKALTLLMMEEHPDHQKVPGVPMRVRAAMTNSFGFGGTNAALLFSEATQP